MKSNQVKPTGAPKENHVNTENKPPSLPTSPTNQHQSPAAKQDEKELETKKERLLAKEVKVPAAVNSEVVTKMESLSLETSSNHGPLETSKKEQSDSQKQAVPLEKELLKGKVDLSKGHQSNEIKQQTTVTSSVEVESVLQKSHVEEGKFVNSSETRSAWIKEPAERKEVKTQDKTPESSTKELEQETKKSEDLNSVKSQGVRGVIRMTNLNSKPQQAVEVEDQEEIQKEDVKLSRKEDSVAKDVPNLKSALAGEGSASTSPEKKTVTFAEPLNEAGEIKLFHLAGRDGKRDVLAPPTLGMHCCCLLYCAVVALVVRKERQQFPSTAPTSTVFRCSVCLRTCILGIRLLTK